MLHIKTVHTAELPTYPCEDCDHVAWARKPLIGGREVVCTHCFPVRLWSPISAEEFAKWHTKSPPKKTKPPVYYEEEAA